MNILTKTSAFLLFAIVSYTPLMAQKKLALANECFNAKAYYLASRYYQQALAKNNDCHPDQIKLAQSLAAIQQLTAAENIFANYMSCQKNSPAVSITYGKFLMDIQAYKRAIPYFEKGMETEPDLARHYILACQIALPKTEEVATSIFVNQASLPQTEAATNERSVTTFPVHKEKEIFNKTNDPTISVSTSLGQIDQTITRNATNEINLYEAMTSVNKTRFDTTETRTTLSKTIITKNPTPESLKVIEEVPAHILVDKKTCPYGVRLGTYKESIIPDLSVVEGYGRIEQKQWNGKTIVFLVDFVSRTAAEAAVKLALREKFRSATLVEKLASGRMKSIR